MNLARECLLVDVLSLGEITSYNHGEKYGAYLNGNIITKLSEHNDGVILPIVDINLSKEYKIIPVISNINPKYTRIKVQKSPSSAEEEEKILFQLIKYLVPVTKTTAMFGTPVFINSCFRQVERFGCTVSKCLINPLDWDIVTQNCNKDIATYADGTFRIWTADIILRDSVPKGAIICFPQPDEIGVIAIQEEKETASAVSIKAGYGIMYAEQMAVCQGEGYNG